MNPLFVSLIVLASGFAPGTQGESQVISQSVDLIELNHFVDREGREVFRQILFYDWSVTHHRYIVRAWRLVKTESQVPRRRWAPERYECVWHDEGKLRKVTAPAFNETWTQYDPERENRKLVAEDQRRPLH